VAELYGPLAEEKRAAFVVDVDDELSVNGDPHLIAQAVGNLVDNAVKFAPCNSAVSLRIGRRDDTAIDIAVADEGPGISDAEKPRITQRFYRCEASCRTAGLGLGLGLVEAVARLHDGSFTLSDNNPGLTASLKLPAGPQMQKDDTATE